MRTVLADLIRQHSQPLPPIATNVIPRLQKLPDIRAVLFDIYGTLLVSASGDVGLQASQSRARSFREATSAVGLSVHGEPAAAMAELQSTIEEAHAEARIAGVEYPEVDIVEMWRRCLSKVATTGGDANLAAWKQCEFERLALEYELRVNPVWPMPAVVETFDWLIDRNMTLGVVSNAQFFTPLLFPVLVGRSLSDLGCAEDLVFHSYAFGRAKPGTYLFEAAMLALAKRGIPAGGVLYVGNDMLNDVAAANQAGFQTALFAGDERSLRWRTDDKRISGIEPSVILTELGQIRECLSSK